MDQVIAISTAPFASSGHGASACWTHPLAELRDVPELATPEPLELASVLTLHSRRVAAELTSCFHRVGIRVGVK